MSTPSGSPSTVRVAGPAPYDVVIGHGVLDRLPGLLPTGAERVAVICPEELDHLLDALLDAAPELTERFDVTVLQVPDGEEAKTAETASACWEALGEEGFTRSDVVVTLGGGATTDLGGFVAATWLRGVAVVHVPTTLLGMVDAAVGGKTGINTDAGKNLVGSFHEPVGVLCDLSLLTTLPRPELVAGLAEVVKCGFIDDTRILQLVEDTDPEALAAAGSEVLAELVVRAVTVKARTVGADLKETAGTAHGVDSRSTHPGREALNYGHTFGHAIERASGYTLRHGEAVAIGCVFVAELAARAGGLDAATVARHRSVLARVGLPTTYDGDASFEDLLAAMAVDKKARGSVIRFVVLQTLGEPVTLAGPDEADLRGAFAAVATR